jgi:VanZ family protein
MSPGDVEFPASRLPHALAVVTALAIVYASLQPFGEWLAPVPGTRFWPLAPGPIRTTRFDVIANVLSYVPLGLFAALIPRRASAIARVGLALATGAALSFALESLQWFLPPRHANLLDFVANSLGALAGGLAALALARNAGLRTRLRALRTRVFLPGTIGDVGLALLVLWLVVQANPAIAPFALTFDATTAPVASTELTVVLLEATESAFQFVGVALFVALLVRERRYAIGVALLVIGAALLVKGVAAVTLLRPALFNAWLSPGVLLGMVGGAILLLPAIMLPRPAQVAVAAIALLSSLLVPLLLPEVMFAAPPLTLFNWRYGHLLNFNGLTRTALLLWPGAVAAWLFALAGRPGWGASAEGGAGEGST